jgi:TPR repeat protein
MRAIVGSHFVVGQCRRNLAFRVVLVLLLVTSAFSFASDVDELVLSAQKAYSAKKYDEALKSYGRAASLGSPTALFQLGAMHERGEGVERNIPEAAKWYERATAAGSVSAAKRLANMYYDGEGVPKDLGRAALLYRRAGDLGDSGSYFTLGQIYWMGSGGPREPEKAVEVFTKAAGKGNPLAMNALGIAYRLGDGVDKNDSAAYAYFKLAHEFGSILAADNLEKLTTLISDSDRSAGEKLLEQLRRKTSTGRRNVNQGIRTQ